MKVKGNARLTEYQPYFAGPKRYGAGRNMPTVGPVDPLGYKERDAKIKAKQRAIRNRMRNVTKNSYLREVAEAPFGGL